MINIKTFKLFTLSFILMSNAHAGKTTYGIGSSLDSDITIFFPIKIDAYLIESSIQYSSSKEKDINFNYTHDRLESLQTLDASVGVFKRNKIYDNTFVYYGARLGYTETIDSYRLIYRDATDNSTSTQNEDGYFLIPTLGVEYEVTKNFSIGLDIGFKYITTEGKRIQKFDSGAQFTTGYVEDTQHLTQSDIIIRYNF